MKKWFYTVGLLFFCGCSSAVERHVANVDVVSSNLITRFPEYYGNSHSIGEISTKLLVWRWSPIRYGFF